MFRGQLPVEQRLNKGPGEWTTEKRMATKGKKGHMKLYLKLHENRSIQVDFVTEGLTNNAS